jgi:hypothetical protein
MWNHVELLPRKYYLTLKEIIAKYERCEVAESMVE